MPLAQITDVPKPAIYNFFRFLGPAGQPFVNDELPTSILSVILRWAIIAAGLFFFVKLIMAGFSYLTSAGDSGKIQSATKNLTNAGLGLLLVFTAYFLAQIIQVVLGINILW